MTTKSSSKPEMAAEIPELIRDPSRANTCYERGRFLGKVKKKLVEKICVKNSEEKTRRIDLVLHYLADECCNLTNFSRENST